LDKAKSWSIPERSVWEAYKRVKANRGAAGVDDQSIEEFEADLQNNLYKLWNRMSLGSYFPPPVKRVQIDKRDGGKRLLGIPTVSDRIAQGVVKGYLEPELERHFHPDSYAYRHGKSALEAVGVARKRCWRYDWALHLDIRAYFCASGEAWRFQRVQFPHRQGERAAPPAIEPWTHGGNEMS